MARTAASSREQRRPKAAPAPLNLFAAPTNATAPAHKDPKDLSEVEKAREAARVEREKAYNIRITEAVQGMKGETYALPGDRVRLISDCQNVLILENLRGVRFPAHTTATDYAAPPKTTAN